MIIYTWCFGLKSCLRGLLLSWEGRRAWVYKTSMLLSSWFKMIGETRKTRRQKIFCHLANWLKSFPYVPTTAIHMNDKLIIEWKCLWWVKMSREHKPTAWSGLPWSIGTLKSAWSSSKAVICEDERKRSENYIISKIKGQYRMKYLILKTQYHFKTPPVSPNQQCNTQNASWAACSYNKLSLTLPVCYKHLIL